MIDGLLFTTLFEIFPESFSATRKYHSTKTVNTPWGVEYEEDPEEKTVTMAECILNTAQGIANSYGIDHAINKYLYTFKKKSVQRQELANFK